MVICKVEQNLTKYVTSILKYLQAATSICKLGFCIGLSVFSLVHTLQYNHGCLSPIFCASNYY